jgi:hypothetical protein
MEGFPSDFGCRREDEGLSFDRGAARRYPIDFCDWSHHHFLGRLRISFPLELTDLLYHISIKQIGIQS